MLGKSLKLHLILITPGGNSHCSMPLAKANTFNFSLAKETTTAWPKPLEAPVTIAILSCKLIINYIYIIFFVISIRKYNLPSEIFIRRYLRYFF